jgi:glycosidase
MLSIKRIARFISWFCFAFVFTSLAAAQSAPEVSKVEPPNWWAGSSINPVRVLVRGKNLSNSKVEPIGPGFNVGNMRVNERGTYLFVDVVIDKNATPGKRGLKINTDNGSVTASFEITAPLAREGRFQGFTTDDIMYLIMPDRFADGDATNNDPAISKGLYDRSKARYYHGGDIQGVINKLPYLKELGITAIWLNPWYDNNNNLNKIEMPEGLPITDYHGYGAIDYYGVEERFGTMEKLREMVDKAHALGIKVIQDQVANHTGPYHLWVQDSPTPTWYNGTKEKHINETWQTWSLMDPNATAQTQDGTLRGWFLDILPDLNQDDTEVARYEIQNTLWWIGMTGIDGIRQDTLPYVHRRFWRDWTSAIKREYPNFTTLGELYDGNPAMTAFFQGGKARYDGVDSGVDTVFDFPLLYPLRSAFALGGDVREIPKMLAHDQLYANPNGLVTFLGLHDMTRFMSEAGASNQGLRMAQTLLMTTRGTPLLYYGDEIAMTGGNDPDNRRDFPGGFSGDPRDAFTKAGRSVEEQAVYEHVRKLCQLRAELEPLRRGSVVNLLSDTPQQYAFARVSAKGSVVVVFNNARQPATVEFNVGPAKVSNGSMLVDRLGMSQELKIENGMMKVMMPGRVASIFTVK